MSNVESASNNNGGVEEANPYLAMREAKIARNQKRLRELGLLKPQQPQQKQPTKAATLTKRKIEKQINAPLRRSSRISSSQSKPDYKDVVLPNEKFSTAGRRKRTLSPVTAVDENDTHTSPSPISIPIPNPTKLIIRLPAAPAPNSVRSIDLDVKSLILGKEDDHGKIGILGKMMESTGKEFIINESFSLAASLEDRQRLENTRLSFNKYCGVQEWRNCIFLWVNLGTADSPNEFLDNAKQVTWFGGSKMHDASPVILKLLEYGKNAATTSSKGYSNIILWCRRYQPDVKKFTPYVCFGRMGYHSHVPGSRPLSFVWNLLDYDGLKNHEEPSVRETFDLFTT